MSITKLFQLILMLVLCCGLMTGCNEKENSQTSANKKSEVAEKVSQTSKTDSSQPEVNSETVNKTKSNAVIDDILKALSDLDETESSLDTLSEDDLLVP